MRRMIPEEKANLLNKQTIDSNGVIVDENDREFNGDVKFTGTVSGVSLLNNHKVVGDISFVGDFDPDSPVSIDLEYFDAALNYKLVGVTIYPDGTVVTPFPSDIAVINSISLSGAGSIAMAVHHLGIGINGQLNVLEYLSQSGSGNGGGLLLEDINNISVYSS